MQREPVLPSEKATRPTRQRNEQSLGSAAGRHHAGRGRPALRAVFAGSYAFAPRNSARGAGGAGRKRAARHGQDRGAEPRGFVSGGGVSPGHSRASSAFPPSTSAHRWRRAPTIRSSMWPSATTRNRSGPGWTAGRFPGPRRQLFRPPEPTQAGGRDHIPDRLQHGEVPGERAAGGPRRLGDPTPPIRAWCSTPAGRPTRSSSRPDRLLIRATGVGAVAKGTRLNAARNSCGRWPPPTTRHRPRKRCRRRDSPSSRTRPSGHHETGQRLGGRSPSRPPARSPWRPSPSRRTSAGCTPEPSAKVASGGRPWRRPSPSPRPGRGGGDRARRPAQRRDRLGHRSPAQVVLRTSVTLSAAPLRRHAMTVVLPVHGSVVTIGSWSFS